MTAEDETAKLIRMLEEEHYEFGSCCVVPQGVFFRSKQLANAFARRHDKDLVQVQGLVSGWLAKNRTA